MDQDAGFELDACTTRAWRRFQGRLADRLTGLRTPEVIVVEAETPQSAAPYLRFSALAGGRVRAEVSGNGRVSSARAAGDDQHARLEALGWPVREAGGDRWQGPEHVTEVPVAECDRLAVMAVRALREVFSVARERES